MADIELVIKIDEEIYKHILSMQFYIPGSRSGKSLLEKILKAIRTGTPLEEELEKMKEKINLEDVDCQYEDDYVYSSGLRKAIELIDSRIEELKKD